MINAFLASGDFCHLLITFANRLDPDQDGQDVSPGLDPNCLTPSDGIPEFFWKASVLKISR